MARPQQPNTPGPRPATVPLIGFFVAFSLAPGLLYQYVQDHARERFAGEQGLLKHFLEIAPNALGTVSATSALFLMILGLSRNMSLPRVALASAFIGVGGIVAWEAAQIAIPSAVFDAADILWTLIGGGAFLIAVRIVFSSFSRSTRAPS